MASWAKTGALECDPWSTKRPELPDIQACRLQPDFGRADSNRTSQRFASVTLLTRVSADVHGCDTFGDGGSSRGRQATASRAGGDMAARAPVLRDLGHVCPGATPAQTG